jgi:hypothetical protein
MIVNFEKDKIIFNVNNSNYFEYMEKRQNGYGASHYSVYTTKLYIERKPQKIGKIKLNPNYITLNENGNFTIT